MPVLARPRERGLKPELGAGGAVAAERSGAALILNAAQFGNRQLRCGTRQQLRCGNSYGAATATLRRGAGAAGCADSVRRIAKYGMRCIVMLHSSCDSGRDVGGSFEWTRPG